MLLNQTCPNKSVLSVAIGSNKGLTSADAVPDNANRQGNQEQEHCKLDHRQIQSRKTPTRHAKTAFEP